jgi:hypothetical protein
MKSNPSLYTSPFYRRNSLLRIVYLSNFMIGRWSPPVFMLILDILRPMFSNRLGILLFEKALLFSISGDFLPEPKESTEVLVKKSN